MRTINAKNSQVTFPISIVVSRFNEEITSRLLDGALLRLRERGFESDLIQVVWVPGAVEIPVAAQKIALGNRVDAIITLGAVIRGDTTHYDSVCEQVSQGCQRVMLDYKIPVIFGILTTENDEQALARSGGAHGNKGADAVDAAVEMVTVLREL